MNNRIKRIKTIAIIAALTTTAMAGPLQQLECFECKQPGVTDASVKYTIQMYPARTLTAVKDHKVIQKIVFTNHTESAVFIDNHSIFTSTYYSKNYKLMLNESSSSKGIKAILIYANGNNKNLDCKLVK